MANITSLGISGLPLDQLLTDLRKSENYALDIIKTRETIAQAKISAYGKLKDAVSALQKAAQEIGKDDSFGAIKVTSDSESISATATNKAIAGQYNIDVETLASSQTMVFAGQADRTENIGSGGTIKITIDGKTNELTLTDGSSLDDIVKAINNDKEIGVNATIVNDGGNSPYRLLLTSRETGVANSVSNITVEGNTELSNFLAYDAQGTNTSINVQDATDAKININGIAITNSSNTMEDVIDGVKINLNKLTEGETVKLRLTEDTDSTKKAINNFVSAYNKMLSSIKSLTSYDIENQQSSALTSDATARNVQTSIRAAISSSFDETGKLTLSQIGITTNPNSGELEVDDELLSKAIADNPDSLKSLFTGESGLSVNVNNAAELFTKSDGIFSTRTDGLNQTIKSIQSQYDATAARIDQRMETYRSQFTKLDAMVSQMNSMGNYLSQQFSSLANMNQSNK